jgi:hypothetical protein
VRLSCTCPVRQPVEGFDKQREYIVVSMTPRSDSSTAGVSSNPNNVR